MFREGPGGGATDVESGGDGVPGVYSVIGNVLE